MNNAFVIWDNSEKGFYESRSEHSIYFTDSADKTQWKLARLVAAELKREYRKAA